MLLRLVALLVILLSGPALAERRVALVLAAEDYQHLRKLANPVHDALAMQDMLESLGFEVNVETDRDLRRMRRALRDFVEDGAGADVAVVFYAGHGVEVAGVNYLLPVDATAGSADEIAATALPLSEVQQALAQVAPVAVVLLDACREDPFGAGATGQGRSAAALDDAPPDAPRPGLGRIGRADGVLFAFSAAPGEVAADGEGTDSPFTEALLRHFPTPGVEVRTALTLVQQDVYDRSRGHQLPYVESGLPKLFFAAASGDLDERDRLLIAMAGLPDDLRAEIEALAKEKDMPLAPLYGALLSANLAGKDAEARRQALVDSAESFLRFRDQLQLLSPEDPQVGVLRVRAEKELELGKFDTARQALEEAAKRDAEARESLRDNYRARTLSEAQTWSLAAQAARADLRYDLALQDLAKALALYGELEGPDLPRADRVAFTDLYWDQGDLFQLVGSSLLAMRAYQAWERVAAARVAEEPDDGDWQRNQAVAQTNVGDMRYARGDLDGAEALYREALAVEQNLSARPDAPLKWRHDVFVTQSKLGDIADLRGNLAEALRLQEQGLTILRQLVVDFPDRDDVRRDLALSLDRVGDLQRVAGHLSEAMAHFNEALVVRQALLAASPDDAARRAAVATSQEKIGDVLIAEGDMAGALAQFQAEVAALDDQLSRDPTNRSLQYSLTIGLIKVGDALLKPDPKAALADYDRALAMRQDLVAADEGNIAWQGGLALAFAKRAEVAIAAQDFATAMRDLQQGLTVARAVVAASPDNIDSLQKLGGLLDRVGDVAMMQGDLAAAQAAVTQSYQSARRLADLAPENGELQTGLVASLVRVAIYSDDPRRELREALAILEGLQAQGRLDPAKFGWMMLIRGQLANFDP